MKNKKPKLEPVLVEPPRKKCLHCGRKFTVGMNDYCNDCVEMSIADHEELRGRQKCVVHRCENYTDQGEFAGSLCVPCHHYLSDPDCKDTSSQALRNEQYHYKLWLRRAAVDFVARLPPVLDLGVSDDEVGLAEFGRRLRKGAFRGCKGSFRG